MFQLPCPLARLHSPTSLHLPAVTMEPDEVETLIDKLKTTIEEGWNKQ